MFARAGGIYQDETSFIANIDGSNERQLGELGASGGGWASRDGKHVVYFGFAPDYRGSVTVAGGDGSNPHVLPLPAGTINIGTGPFSPDGSRLLREGFDDAHPDVAGIYVSNIDGSNINRLTQVHYIPGDWSPDGKQILLFLGPDGEPPPAGSLFTARADGSHVTQLTPDGVNVQCCFGYRWSPDGSKIVFASEGKLWTIAPDGSGLTMVFADTEGRFAITPAWSPDGSMILFGLDPSPDPFRHPYNALYVIRSDGTGLTEVIGGANFKREPTWITQ